jgi:hypothetical protein|tara:strand:+ start:1315 stop:1419 length:105 start_codon:yes stop_codon:yes gene_type:complete
MDISGDAIILYTTIVFALGAMSGLFIAKITDKDE